MLKNIKFVGIFMFVFIKSLNAQTTMSIEEYGAMIQADNSFPEDLRSIVDNNNSLDVYIGEWQGTDSQNNKITFYINPITTSILDNKTLEGLKISYKVEDVNNNLIFDSRLLTNGSYSGFKGKFINSNGYYQGRWGYVIDPQSICTSSGTFAIKRFEEWQGPEYIEFIYGYDEFMMYGFCPNGFETPPIAREENITLIKQ